MADYNYDESGNMSAYFLISVLVILLTPLTLSSLTSSKATASGKGCQCQPCLDQQKSIAKSEGRSLLNPQFTKKSLFIIFGWSLCAYLCYKVAGAEFDQKVYNPFEILGISTAATEKEIKSHYKKLSRVYHPDKVKTTANQTLEEIQERFVSITKAYKSLTDVVIRENFVKYGHPDGMQQTTTGIGLPRWIIEGKNNIWVLGAYGLVFGGALPAIVGRWWFGSRRRTKDGVDVQSAATFFKATKEEGTMDDVFSILATSYKWEGKKILGKGSEKELTELESAIKEKVGERKWNAVLSAKDAAVRRAMILLYSYLLRLDIKGSGLQAEQRKLVLQTPLLLNAFLSVAQPRGWVSPMLSALRLQAYLVQALLPGYSQQKYAQLPGIKADEATELAKKARDVSDVAGVLKSKSDSRAADVEKALHRWGRVELVEASFKVIGERIITPSSFIFLLVKLRITPPGHESKGDENLSVEEAKKRVKARDARDEKFLLAKGDTEDIAPESAPGYAHAPYWPTNRKPGYWIFTVDEQKNRVIVPPVKVSEVPRGTDDDCYRSFKLQFQAPPNTGTVQWRLYVVSDTFVGEELSQVVSFKIDDVSALTADEQGQEDYISEPDEDSIAGQMAMMKGGQVKRIGEEGSDDESGTDDDKDDSDSDSDSDSD